MTTKPHFDLYLLHLPPINLHSIQYLYRFPSEYQSHMTDRPERKTAKKVNLPATPVADIQRLLANR